MKKFKHLYAFLSFAFVVCLLSCCMVVFTACKHKHNFSDWQVTIEATCTAEGEEQRTCECGEVEKRKIDKKEHTYNEFVITTPATCTVNGEKTRTCSVCGNEDKEVIVASHTIVREERIEPTCTTDGQTAREYCSVCGEEMLSSTVLPATGHNMGAYVYNNDRDVENNKNGTHTQKCQNPNCDHEETNPCTYDSVVAKTPTCDEGGYTLHTCEHCGDSFQHDFTDKLGHKYPETYEQVIEDGVSYHVKVCENDPNHIIKEKCEGTEQVVEPTCTSRGYTILTCSTCEHTYKYSETDMTAHKLGSYNHIEEDGTHYHTRDCEDCEYVEKSLCAIETTHITASCTRGGQTITDCEVCGYHNATEPTEKLAHSYGDWIHDDSKTEAESEHYQICDVCGDKVTEKCTGWTEQIDEKATCEQAGKNSLHCPKCSYSYAVEGGIALGHSWSEYEVSSSVDKDGLGGKHSRYCLNGCGATEEHDCEYIGGEITEPTCVLEGHQQMTCSAKGCTNSYDKITPAKGHTYDDNHWEINDETHTRTCIVSSCGYKDISAHDYSETNFCKDCKHDGLIYELDNGEYMVTSDNRVLAAKTIIIPAEHDGFKVTKICSGHKDNKFCAFLNNHTVETVVLPQTLKVIESYAFNYCSNLQHVYIDGEGDDNFNPSLVSIGSSAFGNCSKLASARFPKTLKTIGNYAFKGCSALADIFIPDAVESIGIDAFEGTKYVNDPTNWSADALYIGKHLIRLNPSFVGTYEVVAETKTISEDAFANCTELTGIILPASIIEIDADAFIGCTALSEVTYDGNVAGWLAIKFVNDFSSPMHYAKSLHITNVEEILVIPDSVTSIPAGTFRNTAIREVTIPASVTSIGSNAFEGCASLETITIQGKITRLGAKVFDGTAYYLNKANWTGTEENKKVLYIGNCLVAIESGVTELNVAANTTAIAGEVAMNHQNLTRVVFNESLEFIGERAFKGCKLTYAEFKEPNNWFASMESGMGRLLDLSDKSEATWYAKFLSVSYTSNWIKNYRFSFDD